MDPNYQEYPETDLEAHHEEDHLKSTLERAFCDMAPEGKLPLEQLPQILRSEGLLDPEQVIFSALTTIRSDGKHAAEDTHYVTLNDVIDVYEYCASARRGTDPLLAVSPTSLPQVQGKVGSRGCWKKFRSRMKRCCEDDPSKPKMKPTTRLVIIVVIISFILAACVAAVAIALNWNSSYLKEQTVLKHEIDMVLNAVESLSVQQSTDMEMANMYTMGMILRETVEGIGYGSSVNIASKMQKHVVNISSSIVDTLMVTTSKERVTDFAVGYGNVLTEMCAMGMGGNVLTLFDNLNSKRLGNGLEVILASQGTDGSITYLTSFRKCSSVNASRTAGCNGNAMAVGSQAVIADCFRGYFGSGNVSVDYSGSSVYSAAQPVTCSEVGSSLCLMYTLDTEVRRVRYEEDVVKAVDRVNPTMESTELLMFSVQGKNLVQLQHTSGCSGGKCGEDSTALTAVTTVGSDAMLIGPSYWSADVMAASAYLPTVNAYFVLEVQMDMIRGEILSSLGTAGTAINNKLNGTMEVLLGQKVTVNNTSTMEFLITPRFWSECEPHCKTSGSGSPMVKATVLCQDGVEKGLTDYRGMEILAAFQCIPTLGLGVELKIDTSEVMSNTLQQLADYANLQNRVEPTTLELLVGKRSSLVPGRVSLISNFKDKPYLDCSASDANCVLEPSASGSLSEALDRHTGVIEKEKDYDGVDVMSAFGYCSALDVGIVLKRSVNEIQSPIVIQLLILLSAAFGIALIGVAVEGISARVMLRTIEETWEHARESIEKQKESFEQLVSALYPGFVTERLLAGDHEIVLEIPDATCFFSDICNFTALSNQLNATELLHWIGYTFRVMDHVAEFHRVFKVKTIGDAYFALSGMPNMVVEGEKDEHTLRMVMFAVQVAQLFGGRYKHPAAAEFMEQIASKNVLMQQKGGARRQSAKSGKSGSKAGKSEMSGATSTTSSDDIDGAKNSKTMMRYGVCVGPVTCGVLQGKCPVFDVWGKTVNKASRFEASGRPGNVHVSQLVYDLVKDHPKCLVHWEKGHTVYAKGFGNVQGFFMKSTDLLPPKELLMELGVEPSLGRHYFDDSGNQHHHRLADAKEKTIGNIEERKSSGKSFIMLEEIESSPSVGPA